MTKDRYIEHSFPIVQLNPLSVRERTAFKPIYKMHKWFARRSSSVFRAILLAAALPYDDGEKTTDLMREFYKAHGGDDRLRRPDGKRLRVLDPFMGGGTTVVEALRLGFEVTGVDYNPIAWFIVKNETTPVDAVDLEDGFRRIASTVESELRNVYKTTCPVTRKEADIIYGFWVKQGVCIDPECGQKTRLFKSYKFGQKRGGFSVEYCPDVTCPHCSSPFDWEFDRVSLTAGGGQVEGREPCGTGRPNAAKYTYASRGQAAECPWCSRQVPSIELSDHKSKTKKVDVHVVYDPHASSIFEVRGKLGHEALKTPFGNKLKVADGPVKGAGKFVCAACGRRQSIVESARAHGQPLPFQYFAFYAHTPHPTGQEARASGLAGTNGKWYGAASAADQEKVTVCEETVRGLRKHRIPSQEIYDGYNTNRLVIHQYRHWADTFGPRQLFCLNLLLSAIADEPNARVRDAFLGAFQLAVGFQSLLTRFHVTANKIEHVQSSHDYRNPTTVAEGNLWGVGSMGQATFQNCYAKLIAGLQFGETPSLTAAKGGTVMVADVPMSQWRPKLHCASASDISFLENGYFDIVVTDPPYAGSVQYAEMSDWSYVWLHQVLGDTCPSFGPEFSLKSQEIIEDGAEKNAAFFFSELTKAWKECHRVLKDDGLLAFTFHHAEGDRWTGLLTSLFDAGFYLIAAYPTHSEALNSIVIQATKGITYDIIHVCRKRLEAPEPIPWSRLRREVRKQAREQLAEIEQGKDVLPGPDVQMILIGRALMLFSRHYGKVLDRDGHPMKLDEAMERILLLVREVRGEELPLPGKLQNIDSLSQIVLLHVVGKEGWSRDDLHKDLRGYKHGPKALLDAGLVRPVKDEKAKLEPVPPLERHAKGKLSKQASGSLIDKVHLVLGTVHEGHPIDALMDGWRGQWEQISEALAWLVKAETSLKDLIALARRQIEGLGPEALEDAKVSQLTMFAPTEET